MSIFEGIKATWREWTGKDAGSETSSSHSMQGWERPPEWTGGGGDFSGGDGGDGGDGGGGDGGDY